MDSSAPATTAAAPHAGLPSGGSARAHEAAAAAPYRIPIHVSQNLSVVPTRGFVVKARASMGPRRGAERALTRPLAVALDVLRLAQVLPPGSTTPVAPDFTVCLLDQLHTSEQRAARLAAHAASVAAAAAAGTSAGAATASVASLAADRPTHDRLPVLLAISSHNVAAAAATTTAAAAAEPSNGSTAGVAAAAAVGGVCHVTLLQASDEDAWRAARQRTEHAAHPDVRNVVRTLAVPLAHASRCPCRSPPPAQVDALLADAAESTSAAVAAASVPGLTSATTTPTAAAAAECAAATSIAASAASHSAPAPSQQQLRLAVVVVPTLHSVSHCRRCAPHLPPAVPCPRVLVTRRPGLMRAFPGCWVFPGGACDPTDRSLAHTGARELAEETGLQLAAPAPAPAPVQGHGDDNGDDNGDGDEDRDGHDHPGMRVVSAWEAVFPVIRPASLGPGQRFLPKGRYLIVMFAAEVCARASAGAGAAASDGVGADADAGSDGAAAATAPCVRCEVALRLCPTEVDAAVWLSGAEFEAVRARAAYFHTDDEAALQRLPLPHQPDTPADGASPRRCLADTDECACAELPAMVTRAYYEQHAAHTTLLERPSAATGAGAGATAAAAGLDSTDAVATAAAAAAAAAPPAPGAAAAAACDTASSASSATGGDSSSFLPGHVRCCALFGLYPNRSGSGMAEGHLVALEEMRALGIF